MENLRGQYNWVELPALPDRPNFRCFIMPAGAPVFAGICVVCRAEGKNNKIGARAPTRSGNLAQRCSTGTHTFSWKKASEPAVVLDGYEPARSAPWNPAQDRCARDGCRSQHLQKCAHHRCLKCCVAWAKQEFEAGRDPLNLCAGHRNAVESMIIADQKALEAAIHTSQGSQRQPPVGNDVEEPIPAPTMPAPRRQPATIRRAPAALATPVIRLPTALPADNPAALYETPGMLRQQRLLSLNRLGREKDSLAAERRIKVFWWRKDGTNGVDSFINTQGSSNLFVPADHAGFIDIFERDGDAPMKISVLDWNDGYWTTSALNTPQTLNENGWILVREMGMVDGDCQGLESVKNGRGGGGNGDSAKVLPVGQGESSRKRPRQIHKPKVEDSRPETRPPSSASSAHTSPPPSPPPPPTKRCRMSAKSKSFFMKATYARIYTAFERMGEMQKRGTSAKNAFKRVFPAEKWAKETCRRHKNLFNLVDVETREDWLSRKGDHLWADFWEEYSHLLYDEGFMVSGMEEGDGVDEDDVDATDEEEEEEDSPVTLKVEDVLSGDKKGKQTDDIIELDDSSDSDGPSFKSQTHRRGRPGPKNNDLKVKVEGPSSILAELGLTSSSDDDDDDNKVTRPPLKKEKIRFEDQKTQEGKTMFHVAMHGNQKMYVINDSD